MKKQTFLIFLLFFIFYSSIIFSQEKDSKSQMSYDEIIQTVKRKDVSFIDKYWLEFEHLGYDDQIQIFKELIPYAKKEKDKQYLIKLYCNLYTYLNAVNKDIHENKLYLDTAFMYIGQTKDVNALGNIHFQLGLYYSSQPNSENIAHDYYYKAIPFFEKSEKAYHYLNFIYYQLSSAYANREDTESLRKIVKKMLALKMEGNNRAFLLNIYSTASNYYSIMKTKDSINSSIYLDSSIYYRKEAVTLYETLKDSIPNLNKSNGSISSSYINLAMEMGNKENPHWKEIMDYLEKGKNLIAPNNSQSWIQYYHTKGTLLYLQKMYNKAIVAFKEEETILDESDKFDASDNYYAQLYKNLSLLYEEKGEHRKALEYERKAGKLNAKLNDIKRYETIKDLETKYETAEKELTISHLNEERQQILYNRTLIVGGFIILSVILLSAWLYNRFLRLKKEKESIALSAKIKEKESENQTILKESELKQMQHYLDGLEVERNRLSKDLHDIVANKLYILDQNIRNLDNIPAAIPLQIEELYYQTRNISHELISPSFQHATLPEILFNQIEDLKLRSNITFHLNIKEDSNIDYLSTTLSLEIYRIVQECIGNSIKHSYSKNIWVGITSDHEKISLTIKDDGIGFNTVLKTNGIGLQIMNDRAISLNGSIEIKSEKDKGCEVKVTIPFTLSAADELQ